MSAEAVMKVGDLVRRKKVFVEWMKHNAWMTTDEIEEIGIIIEWGGITDRVVSWPFTGISWEDEEELEAINEEL